MPTDDRRRKEGCISLSPPSAFLPSLQPAPILRYSNGDSSLPLYPFSFLAWLAVIGEERRGKIWRKVSECGEKVCRCQEERREIQTHFVEKPAFPPPPTYVHTVLSAVFICQYSSLPFEFFMNDSRGQAQKKVRGGRVGASRGKLLICRSQCLKRMGNFFASQRPFLGRGRNSIECFFTIDGQPEK